MRLAALLLATTIVVAMAGCMVDPGPTRLAPAANTQVEVVWDNRSDKSFVVSIVGPGPAQQAFALVEPCEAHNVIQHADPPFEVGLGQRDAFVAEPMPMIVTSNDLPAPAEGLYRIGIRIDPDGSVSTGALAGSDPWPMRSGDNC